MQMELAYRLIVEDAVHPEHQEQRDRLPDAGRRGGRPREGGGPASTTKRTGKQVPLSSGRGQYLAHDNNRDGLGLGLNLTNAFLKTYLEWHPTVMHDLHESADYLYQSTGAGPYNVAVDPVLDRRVVDAGEVRVGPTSAACPACGPARSTTAGPRTTSLESQRQLDRSVLQTESYGPANRTVTTDAARSSRPNPALPSIKWGPRNNVNIQQSGLLLALPVHREPRDDAGEPLLKNKRAVGWARGDGPHAWVIPGRRAPRGERRSSWNLLRQAGHRGAHGERRVHAGKRAEWPPATTSSASTGLTAGAR